MLLLLVVVVVLAFKCYKTDEESNKERERVIEKEKLVGNLIRRNDVDVMSNFTIINICCKFVCSAEKWVKISIYSYFKNNSLS